MSNVLTKLKIQEYYYEDNTHIPTVYTNIKIQITYNIVNSYFKK